MKKIRRNQAIEMFARLEQMEIGKFDEATLIATMSNITALRKVKDDFENLKNELFKRLYGDINEMSDEAREELQGFFQALSEMGRASKDEVFELDRDCKEKYPALYDKRVKEMTVIMSLLNKDVDVKIELVDEEAFLKGFVKGNEGATLVEAREVFAPLFVEKEVEETDLSELDEFLEN